MTKCEEIARALNSRQWFSSTELARIQNRFGSSIHLLRTGAFDNRYWCIVKRRSSFGVVEYRHEGFSKKPYVPQSPRCNHCGHKLFVKDDRQTEGQPDWEE